jgi:hypothetical protein
MDYILPAPRPSTAEGRVGHLSATDATMPGANPRAFGRDTPTALRSVKTPGEAIG